LHKQIGEGGYSAVYRADDLQEKRIVALKAISLRDLTSQEQIEATDTFNREVHFLSNLQQRNLPRVYEHFSEQECWYLVMDFIDGNTLEERMEKLKGQPLPYDEVLEIGLVLCNVLDYLHSQEPAIIFRDLKPGNIMLSHSGYLYLIDFGIARRHKPGKERDTIPFGSPGYAAPEQYGRAQTTPAADIYSLGAILHQLCSGSDPAEQPFHFAPLPQPELQALSQLLLTMVEIDVSKRPQRIEEVRKALEYIDAQSKQTRGLYSKISSTRVPPSISYVPPPMPTAQNIGSLTASTAIYTAHGQVQVMQQQNQYYQGPIAIGPRHNKYAIASIAFCLSAIILPVFSCSFAPMLSESMSGLILLWMPLVCLTPGLGGIIFGILGKRQARRVLSLQRTFKSAHNSLIISFIVFSVYLIIFLLFLYSLVSQF
jgi:serine/threonine protein kinase